MVKKLKKYLKFVTCCALITSLIAPNYAALSATDGSAFVTKSEFDSALSDFNARLTTFEAGINSKIDSQVTSYLDRNGIWSGKKQDDIIGQEKIFTTYKDFITSAAKSSTVEKTLWTIDGVITKAGLLKVDIDASLSTVSNTSWRNFIRTNTDSASYDSSMSVQCQVINLGKEVYNTTIINSQPIDGAHLALVFPRSCIYSILCFVSVGDTQLKFVEYWINSNSSSSFSIEDKYGFYKGSGTLTWKCTDAQVY